MCERRAACNPAASAIAAITTIASRIRIRLRSGRRAASMDAIVPLLEAAEAAQHGTARTAREEGPLAGAAGAADREPRVGPREIERPRRGAELEDAAARPVLREQPLEVTLE